MNWSAKLLSKNIKLDTAAKSISIPFSYIQIMEKHDLKL